MSLLLLDTTFLIDHERGQAELDAAIDDDDDVAIAAISIAELRVGALLADRRRRAQRLAFLDDVINEIPVLPYDVRTAGSHGELLAVVRRQGRPRGAHDLIIAATAHSTGRTIVSADRSAFADLPGVEVRPH